MAFSSVKEIPIFVQTNLGTRIVIVVPPDTTVGNLKREFERAHLECFREFGSIRAYGLKVKKKSCFYNLPESFPLKHVFQSLKDHFLHIEVYRLQNLSAESPKAEICRCNLDINDVPISAEAHNVTATRRKNWDRSRRKKRRAKRIFRFKSLLLEFFTAVHFPKRKKNKCSKRRKNIAAKSPVNGFQQGPHCSDDIINNFASRVDSDGEKVLDGNWRTECPSETFSETISVSGIIKRYFTDYDEVTSSSRLSFLSYPTRIKEQSIREKPSNYQNRNFDMPLTLIANTPPQSLDENKPKASRGTDKKSVGRRLVAVADILGVDSSKHSPTLSLFKHRDGQPLLPNSTKRHLVFDLPDEDD